jgi:hypothetical protein
MSRIRLEWNIESQKIDRANGEDPGAQRARRRTLLRFALLLVVLVALLGAAGVLVRQRLLDVQQQMEQLLRDTVNAEVAALRIGDVHTFLNLQHGDDANWRHEQQTRFQTYSEMKISDDLILTGTILELAIDGQRARAAVEEYINGLPYAQVWFYQRQDDGWYHARPDYEFWGESQNIESDGALVEYRDVDQAFAAAISQSVGSWWRQGCDLLQCENRSQLRVTIVTDAAERLAWNDEDRLHLHVLSPYVGRARADMPFSPEIQQALAESIAEQLVNLQTGDALATYPRDIAYLRGATLRYLTDQFLGVYSGATLLHSLAEQYGAEVLAKLVRRFEPDASMAILQHALPVAIEDAQLDWGDLIKWRLNTEAELLIRRDENAWLSLYDTSDASVQELLYARFHDNRPLNARQVVDQLVWQSSSGAPQLRVTVRAQSDSGVIEQIVLFNLVDDVWKRAS